MAKDVILNKIAVVERCLNRINEEYNSDTSNLLDYTKQDSIILNIQRACEACIDLAMHIVSEKNLGIPQASRDAFEMLHNKGIIDKNLNQNLKAMVGFRNIAVHDYQNIEVEILEKIINNHLKDLKEFANLVLNI